MLKEIESISKKKNFIFLVFFLLILIQLEVGFLYPTYDSSTDYWKTIDELKSYKNYSLDSFDNSVFQKIRFLVSNYHIDGDAAAHILLAHDFPEGYLRGNLTYLDRPLYPFLVSVFAKPLHLISNSYIFTFAAGITLNTIFLFLTIVFLYLLVEKLISPRVALLSSCLLIFSPFVRVWLSQPGTNIFGIFTVIVSLYLIYVYQKNPSLSRLIIFSLAIGTLMLGKMLPAISLFILILAISFKRYREGFLFLVIHLIPLFIW